MVAVANDLMPARKRRGAGRLAGATVVDDCDRDKAAAILGRPGVEVGVRWTTGKVTVTLPVNALEDE